MFCKNCGNKLDEGVNFCFSCGTKVGDGNSYCSNCAEKVGSGDICSNCGQIVTSNNESVTEYVSENNSNNQTYNNTSNNNQNYNNQNYNNQYQTNNAGYIKPQKSKIVAGILGILLGSLGIHRFYLGYIGIGILQIVLTICTCGAAGLWGFIEGILILCGTGITTDADGNPLSDN